MSHLGFKILYRILNDDPRTLAERCYAPWVDMEARAPRARPAARLARERAPAPRLRRGRLLAAVRAHLHEHPRDARPRRHPPALERPRRGRPAGHGRRADRDPPRAAGAVHRRLRHRRRRGEGHRGRARLGRLRRRGVPREERLVALARLGGVYVPSLYATRVDADTGFERGRPGRSSPALRFPVERSLVRPRTGTRSRTTAPSAGPRRSSTACRSRSRAAAPRGAASARPG